MNFYFYLPKPHKPPHYLYYDKKYINKNKKITGNGKEQNGGALWGGSRYCGGLNYSNTTFIVLKYFIKLSMSIVVLE